MPESRAMTEPPDAMLARPPPKVLHGVISAPQLAVSEPESETKARSRCPNPFATGCGYAVDGTTKLAVLSLDDGKALHTFELPRLANLRLGVQWTPDGRSLTYRDWANGIWIQSLDGGSPQRLKGLPSEKLYAFDWSPDGRSLAFTRGVESRDVVMISDFR